MIPVVPKLDQASVRRQLWTPEYESISLIPCGWLVAVLLENVPQSAGCMSGSFEVTDESLALYGSFRWEYAMASAGVVLAEPVPNFNAAAPYLVRRGERGETDGPVLPVTVYTVGVW